MIILKYCSSPPPPQHPKVSKHCSSCSLNFALYFCPVCRLYDDVDKQQFHCEKCGLCRYGNQTLVHSISLGVRGRERGRKRRRGGKGEGEGGRESEEGKERGGGREGERRGRGGEEEGREWRRRKGLHICCSNLHVGLVVVRTCTIVTSVDSVFLWP